MQHQFSLSEETNSRLRAEVTKNQEFVASATKHLHERQLQQERKQQRSQKLVQLLTELVPEIIQDLAR